MPTKQNCSPRWRLGSTTIWPVSCPILRNSPPAGNVSRRCWQILACRPANLKKYCAATLFYKTRHRTYIYFANFFAGNPISVVQDKPTLNFRIVQLKMLWRASMRSAPGPAAGAYNTPFSDPLMLDCLGASYFGTSRSKNIPTPTTEATWALTD